MSCCTQCDECATEKTEDKEFAYFSGLLTGRKNERERIIKLLDKALVYDEPVVIERDRLIALIKGENK